MKTLENKVAIITGAGSGIGKAAAELFAKEGAKLILTDINEEQTEKVISELTKQGSEAYFLKADAGSAEDAKKTVDFALEKFNRLDIAVNNAGIAGESLPTAEHPVNAWDTMIKINLSGVFYGMHHQIKAMLEHAKKGSIVNVASILGQVGFLNAPGYVAAKHGVVGLTKTAALEYSSKGIRVNSIGPGFIDTPLLENLDREVYDQLVNLHPIGRLGKAEEVAELILWLASDKSSFVTGSYYPVDGGYLAQ